MTTDAIRGVKMRKKALALGAATGAAALVMTLAGPAQAAETARGCSTEGASGQIVVTNWINPDSELNIQGAIVDRKEDGHHARIRLLTTQGDGDTHHWKWRKTTSSQSFKTTAKDDEGIFLIGVQVARFKGDTLVNTCHDWNV